MSEHSSLDTFKAIVGDAFANSSLQVRQNKAAAILSEAHESLSRGEFKELRDYVFERLEK